MRCTGREADHGGSRRRPAADRNREKERSIFAGRSRRALQPGDRRRRPAAARHPLRRGGATGRLCRPLSRYRRAPRSDDPRLESRAVAAAFKSHRGAGGGRAGADGESGHHQRAAGARKWRGGESHRQPRVPGADSQSALFQQRGVHLGRHEGAGSERISPRQSGDRADHRQRGEKRAAACRARIIPAVRTRSHAAPGHRRGRPRCSRAGKGCRSGNSGVSREMETIVPIGIIGGSGLYEMEGLKFLREEVIETQFGLPSDSYAIGEIDGVGVAFLSRHGVGHRVLPSELNFRANIYGFKTLGVHTIISASAVGSMKEDYHPTDILFPHQFIDRTRHRADTFFGDGIVGHISFANPICAGASFLASEAARECGARVHEGGVYICIEGPQFSTRAESNLYRSWGVDVIGMTNLQEAKLAREAEICYATMALVTDYDCWHAGAEAVSVEQVVGYLRANAEMAQKVLRDAIPRVAARRRDCPCASALQFAVITDPE